LRRQDACHARFAASGKKRYDVPTLPTERRELIDDDERRSGTERRNAHEVEQDPCANLGYQLGVGRRVQAEQDRLACAECIFQCKAWAEI
jgi:hypothetical protein